MRQLLQWIATGVLCCIITAVGMSCSEEADCTNANRPMLNAKVYGYLNDTLYAVALDSLTVTAMETDSVIVNRDANVSAIILPLRYAEETTVFVLHYVGNIKDTVTVTHHNTPYFLSMECGYQMKQEITGIRCTTYGLDSIVLKNPNIGIYGTENIALYY